MHHPTTENTTDFRNLFAIAIVAAVTVLAAPALQAATLTVCASGCDYSSIQGAVNAASSGDVLSLSPETFTEGDILIDKNLTLETSSGRATVDGDDESSVFEIEEDAVVRLEDLTVENATYAILINHGITTLSTVYVNGDGVTTTTYGGIVNYSTGELLIKDSSVVQNNVSILGGGINNFGILEIENSTLIGNEGWYGGGLNNSQGHVWVSASSISNNHAVGRGGGYANVHGSGGTVTVTSTASYSGNTADVDCDKYYDIHRTPSCFN
jgi:hypothetical protein